MRPRGGTPYRTLGAGAGASDETSEDRLVPTSWAHGSLPASYDALRRTPPYGPPGRTLRATVVRALLRTRSAATVSTDRPLKIRNLKLTGKGASANVGVKL